MLKQKNWRCALLIAALITACGLSFAAGLAVQSSNQAPTYLRAGGVRLKVLFDGPSQGSPVDVGEMVLPPGTNPGDHPHNVTEIFYILEGELEHVVNGHSYFLTPGMLGYVKPPDVVNHIVDPDGPPVRAIVIWAPGGEAARITSQWERVD